MYMGPADQEGAFMSSPAGTRMNLMPPPTPDQSEGAAARIALATGGESDQARLARLQSADQPGTRTIGTHTEPPYSDASMANQQNMMLYNARKRFDSGDRSPEIVEMALGAAAPKPMTEYQRTLAEHRRALEQQAANRVIPVQRDMVLERSIIDERSALNKTRQDLAKTPPTSGTDPRISEALYHAKKLKELTDQSRQSRPATTTATVAPNPVQPPATVAPKSTGKRVKVIGPGGKKGTIEEGDALPAGWNLVQ